MPSEIIKRFVTSIVLLPVLFIIIYFGGTYLLFFLSIVYLLSLYEIIKNTRNFLFNIISNSILIFSLLSFLYIRNQDSIGLISIYWILTLTFLSDIGGFVFGKIFKGKKLSKISPNKTYSGAFGSLVLASTSLPLTTFLQKFFLEEVIINFNQISYLFITLTLSLVCQFGDLTVSFFKRRLKIKNTGNFLPGHGGILDRIDGLIFVLIAASILKFSGLI